jgi:hypothetical protein
MTNSVGEQAQPLSSRRVRRTLLAKRLLLAAGTAFLAINIWTGGPLLSLWIGSRFVGERRLSMGAIGIVVITLAVLELAMAMGIAWLDNTYKRITGFPLRENRMTWLRSMNIENETVGEGIRASVLERIVMVNVYVAVAVLVAYFFLFPQSPLPK